MRILYANKFYYPRGGAEKVFLGEMELMEAHGHETAVFACAHPENLTSPYSGYFADYVDYFQSGFLPRARAALKIIYSREARAKFARLIDDFKPDVIHAHNIYAQLSTSILDAARARGIRTVLTAHDYKLVCPSYLMLDHGKVCEKCLGGHFYHCLTTKCHKDDRIASAVYTVESYFNAWTGKYDFLSRVACPSRFLMEKLRSAVSEPKLALLRNPVEIPPEGSGDEGYFLFAGRLSPEKGVWNLVRVFKELHIPLVVAGTGPQELELKRLAEGSSIRFVGHVKGEELNRLYRGAKACVVPSECYDNAPLAVIEPMAYGKPVIGAAIGGIPELIRDGETGRLFKAFDLEELKRVVAETARAPSAVLERMGRAAREWVRDECSREKHYEELLGIYKG